MQDSIIFGILCIMGGMFGVLISFYLTLCFIQWISDTIENKFLLEDRDGKTKQE